MGARKSARAGGQGAGSAPSGAFAYQPDKFRELVLLIAEECADDPSFGDVKLNKILTFSELISYAERGVPITGDKIVAQKQGPVSYSLLPARTQLLKEDACELKKKTVGSKTQIRTVAKRAARRDLFTSEELASIKAAIEIFAQDTATAASNRSHRYSWWKHAEIGERIPHYAILAAANPLPTQEEKDHAKSLIR